MLLYAECFFSILIKMSYLKNAFDDFLSHQLHESQTFLLKCPFRIQINSQNPRTTLCVNSDPSSRLAESFAEHLISGTIFHPRQTK